MKKGILFTLMALLAALLMAFCGCTEQEDVALNDTKNGLSAGSISQGNSQQNSAGEGQGYSQQGSSGEADKNSQTASVGGADDNQQTATSDEMSSNSQSNSSDGGENTSKTTSQVGSQSSVQNNSQVTSQTSSQGNLPTKDELFGIAYLGFGEQFNDVDLSEYLPVIEHNKVETVLLAGHSFFLLIPSNDDVFFEIYGIGTDSDGGTSKWQAAETAPGTPILVRCNDWYDAPSVEIRACGGEKSFDFFTPLHLAKENKLSLPDGAYELAKIN